MNGTQGHASLPQEKILKPGIYYKYANLSHSFKKEQITVKWVQKLPLLGEFSKEALSMLLFYNFTLRTS